MAGERRKEYRDAIEAKRSTEERKNENEDSAARKASHERAWGQRGQSQWAEIVEAILSHEEAAHEEDILLKKRWSNFALLTFESDSEPREAMVVYLMIDVDVRWELISLSDISIRRGER